MSQPHQREDDENSSSLTSKAPLTPLTPQSVSSQLVPSISSPFRRSRFDHRTRRECLEKRKLRESPSQDVKGPSPYPERQFEEKKSERSPSPHEDSTDSQHTGLIRKPQHLMEQSEVKYYRVVYRGVVALLSKADIGASRSGTFLSYGEIIASKYQTKVGDIMAVRVDEVLTGGYAYDPSIPNQPPSSNSKTPKRSNVPGYTTTTSTSPATPAEEDPIDLSGAETPRCEQDGVPHQGFVFSQNRKGSPLVEPLLRPPECEHGRFFYKVVSTTPLKMLSGPSSTAPCSKAMVLPGTVHEVSFRLKLTEHDNQEGIWFLKLAKRKGYIASQKIGAAGRRRSESLVKDVTEEMNSNNLPGSTSEDANVSVLSVLSTSIPSSTAIHPRRRHRPPRRIRVGPPRPLRSKHDTLQNLSVQSHSSDRLQTPSSNVSLLSDDSSNMEHHRSQNTSLERSALSPARSHHSIQQPHPPQHPTFFLMRVIAPRGLRILDGLHFQVNHLIHGANTGISTISNQTDPFLTTRIATTNPAENSVIFDPVSKTRILPRGAIFEASRRMETSDTLFHQGAGLIKLADNSGWVIVPHREELEHQFRSNGRKFESGCVGYEEIGNAIVFDDLKSTSWMRVVARAGVQVACAPSPQEGMEDKSSSPPGSPASSTVEHLALAKSDSASDVASSVGSTFWDAKAMFRIPKRGDVPEDKKGAVDKPAPVSTIVSCGVCVQVEPQIPPEHQHYRHAHQEYARLRGGQGWIPLFLGGRPACVVCPRRNPPESQFGSFWFRVRSKRGIKVRLGPSKRAPSIKSSEGVYFRFECGEFLRASEIMTVYHEDSQGRTLTESFAKLFRNRHDRLHAAMGSSDYRQLATYTTQAEWVQIHDDEKNEIFLQECRAEEPPRIQRHKQGWRYKVVASAGIAIKKGPSFHAEDSGMYIAEQESVAIIERVICPSENGVTWLRLKEGQGWLHDLDEETGEKLIIPHSFRQRTKATNTRPSKPSRRQGTGDDKNEKIAYNTIIARLFHNDLPTDHIPRSPGCQPDNTAM